MTENLENEWTGPGAPPAAAGVLRRPAGVTAAASDAGPVAAELEQQARERLDPAVYDFFAGGADDELTLRANEAAFARIGLVPRVLRGGGRPRLEVELLGSRASMPVVIAPTAFHRLAHPDGERATRARAAAAGTVMIASMASTVAIEEIAARARARGSSSTSSPTWASPRRWSGGRRRRLRRAGRHRRLAGVRSSRARPAQRLRRPAGRDVLREHARRRRPGAAVRLHAGALVGARRVAARRDHAADRAEGRRAPARTPGSPSRPASTRSSSPTTAAASSTPCRRPSTCCRRSSTRSAASVPLLLDGGVRRGTDVVKACALGATAVGDRAAGAVGTRRRRRARRAHVLELLRAELERALVLCGCDSPADRPRPADPGEVVDHGDARAAPPRAAGAGSLPYWLPRASSRCGCASSPGSTATRRSRSPGRTRRRGHFEGVYAHPAADGRSRGAALSDLFWYWLSPGPEMHQEHLEPGERYDEVARATRRILAMPARRWRAGRDCAAGCSTSGGRAGPGALSGCAT